MDALLLSISKLTAGYGDADVLHGVSLEVREEEIVAIVGPNGAGKSTVLNAVMGLLDVRGGEIVYRGRSIRGRPTETMRSVGISYVPQVANVFPSLSVEENLVVGMKRGPALTALIDEMMELFPALKPRIRMRGGQLSGGERQMLAFARGMISKPGLLLLDEPSAALSPVLAEAIFDQIDAINRHGTTILLVEQNVQKALEICDRAYVLDSGQNALSGTGHELLCNADMAKLYLGGGATEKSREHPLTPTWRNE